MPIDDIWRQYERKLEVFWFASFDTIPPSPGVYAWFYPLRITSLDLTEVLEEFRKVHLFDARTQQKPTASGSGRVGWTQLDWTLSFNNPPIAAETSAAKAWDRLAQHPDSDAFRDLRTAILASSLLMPPLYIGKSSNLRVRCGNHIADTSGFAKRFCRFAEASSLGSRRVRDLILVTVRTADLTEGTEDTEIEEGLVETILKTVARPPYGIL